MSDNPRATLEFLARQQEQILAELANIRADHVALPAIIQRIDAAIAASQHAQILDELAKMRADHATLLAIVQRIDATISGHRVEQPEP